MIVGKWRLFLDTNPRGQRKGGTGAKVGRGSQGTSTPVVVGSCSAPQHLRPTWSTLLLLLYSLIFPLPLSSLSCVLHLQFHILGYAAVHTGLSLLCASSSVPSLPLFLFSLTCCPLHLLLFSSSASLRAPPLLLRAQSKSALGPTHRPNTVVQVQQSMLGRRRQLH